VFAAEEHAARNKEMDRETNEKPLDIASA